MNHELRIRNMRKYILLSVVFLFFAGTGRLFSQVSTAGTDFWVSFGFNGGHVHAEDNVTSDFLTLQIRIVAAQDAEVTLTFTDDGSTQTFSVPGGTVYTKGLTATEKVKVSPSYSSPTTGSSKKSLRIQSTTPVSVYAFNQYRAVTDATNVLPADRLGTSYYQVSYAPGVNTTYTGYFDGYTVIATEDGTNVYDNGSLKASLNKGGVYTYYASSITTDLTGKYITSNKPIAHFVTNSNINIPYQKQSADILYQQMMPVDMWGNKFLVPVTKRGVERVRIVASRANTKITQVGGTIKADDGGSSSLTIGAGKFVELEIKSSSNGCYITADKPVAVCSYMVGYSYAEAEGSISKGDPAVAWIPPFDQAIESTTIAPFIPNNAGESQLNEHHVMIVTSTATKNETSMAIGNNAIQSLTGGTWTDNTSSGYSYYSLPLTSGNNTSYTFKNRNGVIVLGYGLGAFETYYYLAGAAARALVPSFYVNGIHYQDLNGRTLCEAPYKVKGFVNADVMSTAAGHIVWTLDGAPQTAAQDELEWTIPDLENGTHTITMTVRNTSGSTETISSTFTVYCAVTETIDAVDDYAQTLSSTSTGFPVQIDVLANDDLGTCDASTITLTLDADAQPAHGTVVLDATKKPIYTPNAGYAGTDSFGYIIECNGVSDAATVHITVVKITDNITLSAGDICAGETVTMTCNTVLTGSDDTYQWQSSNDDSEWTNITGATQKTYTVTNRKRGIIFYRAVVNTTVNTQSVYVRTRACSLPVNHNIGVSGY